MKTMKNWREVVPAKPHIVKKNVYAFTYTLIRLYGPRFVNYSNKPNSHKTGTKLDPYRSLFSDPRYPK